MAVEAGQQAWESWTCTRCETHNSHRGFCSQCGMQLVVYPSGTGPVIPRPNRVPQPTPVAEPMPSAAPAPQTVVEPSSEPSSPPSHRKRRRLMPAVAVVIVVLLVAGAGGYFMLGRKTKPSYPKAWDPRVADIAAFVETERGLHFGHPVYVDFLTPSEYSKKTRTDESTVTAADKAEIERTTGILRAVGLISGKVDLLGAANTLQDQGTLALYDSHDKRVRVRGTQMTPSLRVTLAHELTHAAQDQHFDLNRMDKMKSQEASDAFQAVVEGDAERIENKYVDTLNDADRKSYEDEQDKEQGDDTLKDVPPALTAFFASPYALGSQLVNLLDSKGGNSSVDEALRTPPANQAQLLDPFRFLSHEAAQHVPVPALSAGDKRIDDSNEFGAVALYLVLAGRIDPHRALQATDDWAGDASLDYTHAGKSCVDATFAGTNPSATDDLAAALTDWSKTMPPSTATVERVGPYAKLHSCDPGEQASTTAASGASADSLILPVTRAEISTELIKSGAPQPVARCVSGKIIGAYSIDQLKSDDQSQFQSQAYIKQVQGFVVSCR
jgi:hypothetical protein